MYNVQHMYMYLEQDIPYIYMYMYMYMHKHVIPKLHDPLTETYTIHYSTCAHVYITAYTH